MSPIVPEPAVHSDAWTRFPAKIRAKLWAHSSDKEMMISLSYRPKGACRPLEYKQIESRLGSAPCLPSLSSIESALKELLSADQRYTTQIAEIIRSDPSLTSRLLHLVNSVYYGLANPIKNIEEAVFFLGVRQIRQLSMVTPIIEDFQKLTTDRRFPWRQFWRHCIGTALLTRELVDLVETPEGESDYVSGLIHDVGKIVMSSVFPEHFRAIYYAQPDRGGELVEIEREVLGMDHAELGALYLKKQRLPDIFVEVAQFHHHPDAAPVPSRTVAAVEVADLMVRHTKIGDSGNYAQVPKDSWMASAGWEILFAGQTDGEQTIAVASLGRSLARIPAILECLL
jgi:putative nucleotidyltransferase with HDIG domain